MKAVTIEEPQPHGISKAKAVALRKKWDREIAWAKKYGKRYTSAKELFADLDKKISNRGHVQGHNNKGVR
jgi:uncharacterized protein YeaO (DUF488 family)